MLHETEREVGKNKDQSALLNMRKKFLFSALAANRRLASSSISSSLSITPIEYQTTVTIPMNADTTHLDVARMINMFLTMKLWPTYPVMARIPFGSHPNFCKYGPRGRPVRSVVEA